MNNKLKQKFYQSNPVRHFKSQHHLLRLASLGGFASVTQNMFVYEFAPNGDFAKSEIIIVDCGAGFPQEDAFGVDMQIPDISYLKGKQNRLKAILITHGHEDHIGAIRYLLPQLKSQVPIFAPQLAAAFIQSRLEETNQKANLQIYDDSSPLNLGSFVVEAVRVTHSIPDTYHFAISTPLGLFYHGSDFKFDIFPLFGHPPDLSHIARIGQHSVTCLLSDCLGADHPGFSPSERSLAEKFKQEIVSSKGRVFVTSISSNIVRWSQAIEYAKSAGRKIVILGMSIDKAVGLSCQLGYLNLAKKDLIPSNRASNFRDNQLLFLVAGFAGQPDSALSKMIMGKHQLKFKANDKIIFSSPDYIPGTAGKINSMIDSLSQIGVEVVYGADKLHVSGHGYQKEQGILINLLKPKLLLPIGGNYRHIRAFQQIAQNLGYQPQQIIIPPNDQVVTFHGDRQYDTKFRLPLRRVLVDGLGVGDVGVTVLRDRRLLAQDGMFTIVLLINSQNGQLVKDPVILSRGFVFVKQRGDLLEYLKKEVIAKFKQVNSQPPNFEFIRDQIQGHIEEIILQKTGRQPMVLPLVIQV